jgi:hypothetical protein
MANTLLAAFFNRPLMVRDATGLKPHGLVLALPILKILPLDDWLVERYSAGRPFVFRIMMFQEKKQVHGPNPVTFIPMHEV